MLSVAHDGPGSETAPLAHASSDTAGDEMAFAQLGTLELPEAQPASDVSTSGKLNHLARISANALRVEAMAIFGLSGKGWELLGSTPISPPIRAAEVGLGEVLRTGAVGSFTAGAAKWIVRPVVDGGNVEAALVYKAPPSPPFEPLLGDVDTSILIELRRSDEAGRLRSLEEDLWKSRTRYRELSEAAASGIAVVSTMGEIQEINHLAAVIIGMEPPEAIGRDFRDFIAPESLEQAMKEFGTRLAGDLKRRETEIKIVRPCGERRLVQICSSAILGDNGLEGVYFAARDITEERARDSQLRRAERLASIAPLLSGVCHELNNPLTSIKSFAELMLLDDRQPEDTEALEIIQREAARAARIVTDLRMVARQTQEESLNASVFDLNDLIREALQEVQNECTAAEITIQMELARGLPPSFGVKTQLERVVGQLLSNSIRAMREVEGPRRLKLRTATSDLGVEFTVADTGGGISPDHIDNIFDPFWTTRPTGEGTGLGLSLVHGIVSDHHGTIRVDGGWGSGAAFTVELPTAAAAPRPGREAQVQTPARKTLRILVVDDEGPIRFTLARYMERRGHTVMDAAEGEQALALLDEHLAHPFDVILADLRMPGLSAEELYARLRQRNEGLEDRLIFITGDAESPDAARLLEEAGVPVVLKPFELAEIAQIIETHAGMDG